jgi:hypothetical protein
MFLQHFGHHEMKSPVTMSCLGLLVECRVERSSNPGSRVTTYICDSCGRVATSVRADKLSHCCKKTTHPSVEIATEIPIPKWMFGTDFIAVVCRGKVVDILLLSDRTSVHTTLHECGMDMQGFVDNLLGDKFREATDIEVKYGNNVYVVRQEEGISRILIPAISTVVESGTDYLSVRERHRILALALNNTPPARDTPAIQAADGISSPPHIRLPTEEAVDEGDFVPEGRQRVWCNQCEMLSINGVPCHEAAARTSTRFGTPMRFPSPKAAVRIANTGSG